MQNRMVLGILSLCLGVLVFSLQDPLVKAVSGGYPVTEVMAIRAIVALPILIVVVQADVGLRAVLSKRFGMLTLRAFIFIRKFKQYTDSTYRPRLVGKGEFNTAMPWLAYAGMREKDLAAIYAYLRTVKPIHNAVTRVVTP